MTELLPIKQIKQSSSLQPRAKMDTGKIDEYTESMKRGDAFPAVIVYRVGGDLFLVDGYHRFMAAQGAKLEKILAEVKTGTMREAILHSAGVNATHGIQRSNEDKRRAAGILLRDKEWGQWNDTKIAEACHVSVDLVANVRKSILGETDRCTPEKRKVERAGKVFKMDTSKIGKKEKPAEVPEPAPAPVPEKKKPSDAFCYQKGEMPKASDDPVLSLGEKERQKEMAAADNDQATLPPIRTEPPQPHCGYSDGKNCNIGWTTCSYCHNYLPPAPAQHVNPGPAVMVNPVIINDTHRQSPFRNGNQVKAHDKDPLGIGPAPADPVPTAPAEKIDPAKELKERRNRLAKELATTYSERTQRDIQDLIHENPTWRNEEADVFYFGIEALRNPPKVSVSAGSMIRR